MSNLNSYKKAELSCAKTQVIVSSPPSSPLVEMVCADTMSHKKVAAECGGLYLVFLGAPLLEISGFTTGRTELYINN